MGHLVHMPGHTYLRVGRWADAVNTNKAALDTDAAIAKRWGSVHQVKGEGCTGDGARASFIRCLFFKVGKLQARPLHVVPQQYTMPTLNTKISGTDCG
jgi:hypothetical protein